MLLVAIVPKLSKAGGKSALSRTVPRAREQDLRSKLEQPKRHVCAVLLVAIVPRLLCRKSARLFASFWRGKKKEPRRLEAKARTKHRRKN